jgi:glycosyltransferase involved in cell wall biosynthesis
VHLVRVIAKLEPGGAQLGVLRLTVALRRHGIGSRVLAGHATRDGLRLYARAGVAVEEFGGGPELQYECSPEFADWVRPRLYGADAVHAHMFGGWWAAARAALPGLPLVASEHNALRWPGRPQLDAMRAALQRVQLFYAHGPSARAVCVALGVPSERLRAGRSPVVGLDAQPLRSLPVPRIVFAGRLHREKGPDLLVEALASMKRPPAAMLLGAGPAEPDLRTLIARRRLGSVARLCGWQPQPERFIAGSAACVVPSRTEAWSQTAVTALGLGVPVVGTAVEGLPETLGSNRGVLVAPEDPAALAEAIEAVVEGRLRTAREGGRTYARRFLPDVLAAEYAAEYRRLVAGPRAGPVAAAA